MILRYSKASRDTAGVLGQLDMFLRIGVRLIPASDGSLEHLLSELKEARDTYELATARFWEVCKCKGEDSLPVAGEENDRIMRAADAQNAARAALVTAVKKTSSFLELQERQYRLLTDPLAQAASA